MNITKEEIWVGEEVHQAEEEVVQVHQEEAVQVAECVQAVGEAVVDATGIHHIEQ